MRVYCLFMALGKLGLGVVFSLYLKWDQLNFPVTQGAIKKRQYFMRSCSIFFWWLSLRCLQLSLMIGWRSVFLCLVFFVQLAHLLASCVLIGSLAKLLFSFSMRSVLAPCRWLMLSLARWSHQWLSSWLLKSIVIPNSFMVSVPRMRSCCGLLFLSYSTSTSGSE